MHIAGVALWLLAGMFGFGAMAGLAASILITRWLIKPERGDWLKPLFGALFNVVLMVVAMPLEGIAAVALTFAAHHAGWDMPLPYLAGAGLVFLAVVTGWVVWIVNKPSTSH